MKFLWISDFILRFLASLCASKTCKPFKLNMLRLRLLCFSRFGQLLRSKGTRLSSNDVKQLNPYVHVEHWDWNIIHTKTHKLHFVPPSSGLFLKDWQPKL